MGTKTSREAWRSKETNKRKKQRKLLRAFPIYKHSWVKRFTGEKPKSEKQSRKKRKIMKRLMYSRVAHRVTHEHTDQDAMNKLERAGKTRKSMKTFDTHARHPSNTSWTLTEKRKQDVKGWKKGVHSSSSFSPFPYTHNSSTSSSPSYAHAPLFLHTRKAMDAKTMKALLRNWLSVSLKSGK